MTTTTTTFKIHLSEQNIRKLRVDLSNHNFNTFTDLLRENYERFLLRDFVIQYYDEDNDLISVDSQIEWEEMTLGRDSLVIYVKSDDAREESDEDSAGDEVDGGDVLEALGGLFSRLFVPQGNVRDCYERRCAAVRERAFHWCFRNGIGMMERGDKQSLLIAKRFFEKALQSVPNESTAIYNIACVESLLGKTEEAVNTLKVAINAGWNKLTHMVEDPDLENIRHTQGFEECVLLLSESDQEVPLHEEFNSPVPTTEVESSPVSVDITTPEKLKSEENHVEMVTLPFETVFESQEPEPENPLDAISKVLTDMGIYFNDEDLAELSHKFGNDLTRIINHHFTSFSH